MRSSPPLALALVAAALAVPAHAITWHVPSECTTIQAGIDSAAVGDTVLVACDIYSEHDIIMKSGVCLTSETGQADCVTIDAQQLGRVIFCMDVDDDASIVGVTIAGGAAPGGRALEDSLGGGIMCVESSPAIVDCEFAGNTAALAGGGLCCWWNADPEITNCTFSGNSSYEGGGMCCAIDCFPELTDCTFSGNTAYDGGGMICFLSYATLTGCSFTGNTATSVGGGMTSSESMPTLTDCTFTDNTATECGGGLRIGANELAVIDNCRFTYNTANKGGGVWIHSGGNLTRAERRFSRLVGGSVGQRASGRQSMFTSCVFGRNQAMYGGGLHVEDEADALLGNCTFCRNAASVAGGGIYCEDMALVGLGNCVIALSESGGAVRCVDDAAVALICSDIFGNDGGDWTDCIAGQAATNGNFSEHPLFCGEDNPDEPLALHSDSPCAAANNPECGLVGACDVGCEVPVEATSWGAIKAMFR